MSRKNIVGNSSAKKQGKNPFVKKELYISYFITVGIFASIMFLLMLLSDWDAYNFVATSALLKEVYAVLGIIVTVVYALIKRNSAVTLGMFLGSITPCIVFWIIVGRIFFGFDPRPFDSPEQEAMFLR